MALLNILYYIIFGSFLNSPLGSHCASITGTIAAKRSASSDCKKISGFGKFFFFFVAVKTI
jgi:hypothetical protein